MSASGQLQTCVFSLINTYMTDNQMPNKPVFRHLHINHSSIYKDYCIMKYSCTEIKQLDMHIKKKIILY